MRKTALAHSVAGIALWVAMAAGAAAQTAVPGDALNAGPSNQPPVTTSGGGVPDEIIVTGSRIRRDPLSLPAPVTFLDKTALERTGLSSTADILQRLPISGGGLNTRNNSSGNLGNPPDGGGVGAGAAQIDLRYLGANRTLVLLDGLRVVPGASASGIPASVDLNIIPNGLVERIEVLQDGAAPIYGSDAIAGVVNIITRKKQRGFDASAQASGFFEKGDGFTQDYSLSYGAGSERVNIVFGGSYTKQNAVFSSDRAISVFPTPYATSCAAGGCSSATLNGRFDIFNPVGGGFLSLALRQPTTGVPIFNPLNPTGTATSFKAFGTEDRFNFKPFNYLVTPNERYGAFVNASADFGGVTARVKAIYNRRESANQAAPLPLFIGPGAGNGNLLDTISIDASNPFNPFGTLNSGTNGGPVTYDTVRRRLIEGGPRHYDQKVDTFYLTGTLEGSFHLGSHKFFWDINAIEGLNTAKQNFTGNVNAAKVQQALGPIANCTGECVPLDVFGGQGTITPAQYNFIAFTEHDQSKQELTDFSANISGALFDLPAGPLSLAAGYEHRYTFGAFDPDPLITAGLGADIRAQPGRGSLKADEVYGELRAPIFKDRPYFKLLEASFAVRYSNYSLFGDTTNLKAGFLWQPNADLTLRGNWAQGFRAPSIGELFGGASRFDNNLIDPCNNPNGTLPANVVANCVANGVPANINYVQDGGVTGGQISLTTGGNTALKPETSTSYTAGVVISPSFLRNRGFSKRLDIEASYYDISLNGAIRAIGGDTLLSRCALTGDALSCAAVRRSPVTGNVLNVSALLQNIGAITTNGVDLSLTYRSPDSRMGSFGLFFAGTYLIKYREIVPATSGFTRLARDGTERGSPDQAYPRFKGNLTADWALGPVNASVGARYITAVQDETDGIRLSPKLYLDLTAGYRPPVLDNRLQFTIGVNNVLDRDPPVCPSCNNGAYDPGTYDTPGRFGFVRVTYRR